MVRTEATLSLVRGVDKGDTSEVVLHALPEGKQKRPKTDSELGMAAQAPNSVFDISGQKVRSCVRPLA